MRSINCCSPRLIYLNGMGNRILSKETNINYKPMSGKTNIEIHMIDHNSNTINLSPTYQYNQDIYMTQNNETSKPEATSPLVAPQIAIQPVPSEKIETQSFQQSFTDFSTQIAQWKNWTSEQCKEFKGWDQRLARNITDLKKDYILNIGGLMNRSICMAVSSGISYRLISRDTASLFARTRNLAACFVANGWLFLPELFNPFLKHE